MSKIINGTATRTSFQDSQSYVTFIFSEWCISAKVCICECLRVMIIDITLVFCHVSERGFMASLTDLFQINFFVRALKI